MAVYCPNCATKQEPNQRFCHACAYDLSEETSLAASLDNHSMQAGKMTTFEGMPQLAKLLDEQYAWVEANTPLAPLQRLLDRSRLRSDLRQATDLQKEAILHGYHQYAQAQVQLIVDRVRNQGRREADQVDIDKMKKLAELEHALREEEHRRAKELQAAQHQHEREMLKLAKALEISSVILEARNKLKLIPLEAEVKGQAKVRAVRQYEVIQEAFNVLAAIDASKLSYARQMKDLGFDDLTQSESFQRLDDLVNALMESITQDILRSGLDLENFTHDL